MVELAFCGPTTEIAQAVAGRIGESCRRLQTAGNDAGRPCELDEDRLGDLVQTDVISAMVLTGKAVERRGMGIPRT